MRSGRLAVTLAAFALLALVHPAAGTAAPTLGATQIATADRPVHIAHTPANPSLLFVVERTGRIRVLQNEQLVATPFLDITKIVRAAPDPLAGNEEGLLSVAFAPDYASSGRFYVYFTQNNGSIAIDEFRRSAASPLVADAASRRRVMTIPHPIYFHHNGGQLQFGPDGYLYAATGDGGGSPSGETSRKLTSLLGKLLRIDPRQTLLRPYSIPPTNPYAGARAGKDEIYAYGLRNPWRFTFDGTRLALADVGAGAVEEVNLLEVADAHGANFGWPQYEGDVLKFPTRPGPDPPTFPIHTYTHAGGGCAVTGGHVMHDPALAAFEGRYVYGDFCTGQVRTFLPDVPAQQAIDDGPAGVTVPQLSSFGVGAAGQTYAASLAGGIYRLAAN